MRRRHNALDDTALRHVDNRYYDGVHYDRRYRNYVHDIGFWCGLAASVGHDVLELAAGTGRLSFPMAQRGAEVVGLDISPAMLTRAAAKAGLASNPAFLHGDMRDFDLDRRFDLVMIACSSICHLLSDADLRRCLAAVARHLRAGGTFAFDLVTACRESQIADGTWRLRFSYPDPAGDGDVVVRGRRTYDSPTRMLSDDLEYTFTSDGRVEKVSRLSRMYAEADLCPFLAGAGFEVVQCYGGFDREPLTPQSDTQVFVCKQQRRMF